MAQIKRTPVFLLVEDIPVNMLLLKKLISMNYPDAEIHQAEDGQQAIDILENVVPDIIFMDIQMPVMNGLEATREIRKSDRFNAVTIIALTAGIMADEREQCIEAGMNDYLVKPVAMQDLKTIFKQYLTS